MVSHKRKENSTTRAIKPSIICGIEIETEYNANIITDLNPGDYHSTHGIKWFSRKFAVERDGSLRSQDFDNGRTAEFVSVPFKIGDHKKILEDFKDHVKSYGKSALSDVLSFNDSTGAHIHLSVVNHKKGISSVYKIIDRKRTFSMNNSKGIFLKMIKPRTLFKVNKMILERVKREMPGVYGDFKSRFYRDYAKKEIRPSDRYSCWNFSTNGYDHLEFRSFHLFGIRTWDDFMKIYEIAFDVINKVIGGAVKKKLKNKDSLKFSVNENDLRSVGNIDLSFRRNLAPEEIVLTIGE